MATQITQFSQLPTNAKERKVKAAFYRLFDPTNGHPELLDKMVLAITRKAIAGDVNAFNAVADRVDGKVAQAIEPGGDDGSMREWLMWMLAPELAAMRAKHIEGDTRSVSPPANDINGLAPDTPTAQPSLLEQAWGAPSPPGVESK